MWQISGLYVNPKTRRSVKGRWYSLITTRFTIDNPSIVTLILCMSVDDGGHALE
jgi:hypothetical protein